MGDRKPNPADDVPIDVPEADVAEQHRERADDGADDEPTPFDADPADAAEQRIEVGFDDDEYR